MLDEPEEVVNILHEIAEIALTKGKKSSPEVA
jgi:hypothetical protein